MLAEFENKVAKLFTIMGYKVQRDLFIENRQIDILAERTDGLITTKIIVECKDEDKNIGIKKVQDFYNIVNVANVNKGIFISSKGFVRNAKAFAEAKANLDLFTYDEFAGDWHISSNQYTGTAKDYINQVVQEIESGEAGKFNINDYLNDGKITYIFFPNQNNEKRLIVWSTRSDCHILKSYNLNNGKLYGKEKLLRQYFIYDYRIYGPFGNKAWGYSKKSGVQLLDLYHPKILFTNKEILDRNPQLGSKISIYKGYNYSPYEPISYGLYVINTKAEIYRINPDLNAVFAGDITIEKIKNQQK